MAYIECVCVTLKGIQVDKELKREKHMCHESTMHNRMNMTDLNLMTTSVLSVSPPPDPTAFSTITLWPLRSGNRTRLSGSLNLTSGWIWTLTLTLDQVLKIRTHRANRRTQQTRVGLMVLILIHSSPGCGKRHNWQLPLRHFRLTPSIYKQLNFYPTDSIINKGGNRKR